MVASIQLGAIVSLESGVEGIEVIREYCWAAACNLNELAGGGSSNHRCYVLETLPSWVEVPSCKCLLNFLFIFQFGRCDGMLLLSVNLLFVSFRASEEVSLFLVEAFVSQPRLIVEEDYNL